MMDSFAKYGIKVDQQSDDQQTASTVDLSNLKKGFLLSKISVNTEPETSKDDFSADDIAKIKHALGCEDIPDEEAEKFGLRFDRFQKSHLDQPA